MVLRAERHAGTAVGLEVGKIDQIFRFGKRFGDIVLLESRGIAAPVQRNRRPFHFDATELAGAVQTPHARKFLLEDIKIFVGEIRQAVANGDIGLFDANGVHKLPQQSEEHLRRGIHIVLFGL